MKIKASERHHSFHVDKVWDREGYTDPTYIETKRASHKSDIYSFGIVMFELLCGRKAVINDDQNNKYLAPMAILHYREEKLEDLVEWHLWKQIDPQSFKVFTEIAYDCLNEERSQRPSIDEIVPKLEKALKLACENRPIMSLPSNQFAHLKVPLENILSATNNFVQENVIRYTGVAKDYRGQLVWSGELIDISARRFNKERTDREQLFWMEISMLSSLKHKNLVSIVGFCDENDEKIIINRNESARGMLCEYLSDSMLLTWVRRLEICVGLAHALSYIHYDEPRDFSVIHRLISSGSAVLNDEWEPKLCDFEISMKIKASQRHNSFHTNTVKYVDGYGDPTYIETKRVSHNSDIYSFGIVLFELLCGRKSIIDGDTNKYLAPLAATHYREKRLDEIIDWDLWKQMDSQSFNIFAETAYDCLNEEQSQRPNIDEIVTRLEKALDYQNAIMSLPSNEFAHLNVPLENILFATNNFAEENAISTEKRLSPIPEAMNKGKKEMAVNYNILSKEKHVTTEIKLSREDIEQHYGKTMKKAAEELGVSLSTLKRKHNKLGMSGWQGPDLPQRKAYNSSNNQSTESHTHEKDNGIIQDPSPVKRNDKTVIKAEYADDIIKLHLGISELTFVTVENEIGKKLKLKHGTFKIKYLDEDEEWILMTSEQDMRDCMQNSRNVDGSVVRLHVLLHNQ